GRRHWTSRSGSWRNGSRRTRRERRSDARGRCNGHDRRTGDGGDTGAPEPESGGSEPRTGVRAGWPGCRAGDHEGDGSMGRVDATAEGAAQARTGRLCEGAERTATGGHAAMFGDAEASGSSKKMTLEAWMAFKEMFRQGPGREPDI